MILAKTKATLLVNEFKMLYTKAFIATTLAAGAQAVLYPGQSNLNHTCAVKTPQPDAILSCSAQANVSRVDSCCVETYGGLFLATQFWDTYTGLESSGQKLPAAEWTIVSSRCKVWKRNEKARLTCSSARSLARLLQRLLHSILRPKQTIRPRPLPQHNQRSRQRNRRARMERARQHHLVPPTARQIRPARLHE